MIWIRDLLQLQISPSLRNQGLHGILVFLWVAKIQQGCVSDLVSHGVTQTWEIPGILEMVIISQGITQEGTFLPQWFPCWDHRPMNGLGSQFKTCLDGMLSQGALFCFLMLACHAAHRLPTMSTTS